MAWDDVSLDVHVAELPGVDMSWPLLLEHYLTVDVSLKMRKFFLVVRVWSSWDGPIPEMHPGSIDAETGLKDAVVECTVRFDSGPGKLLELRKKIRMTFRVLLPAQNTREVEENWFGPSTPCREHTKVCEGVLHSSNQLTGTTQLLAI
jgi:hypothetical protein